MIPLQIAVCQQRRCHNAIIPGSCAYYYSPKLEDTYYSQIIPGIICQDLLVGGHGLGGICDHINHFGYHIKEIGLLKIWGARGPAMLKGPGENTD